MITKMYSCFSILTLITHNINTPGGIILIWVFNKNSKDVLYVISSYLDKKYMHSLRSNLKIFVMIQMNVPST